MTYRKNSIELAVNTNDLSISPAENAKRNREVYLNILKEEKKQAKIKLKKEKENSKKLSLKEMEEVQETFQYFLNEINKLSEKGHNHIDFYLFKEGNKSINSDIFSDAFESLDLKPSIFVGLLFIIMLFVSMILFLTDEIINLLTFGNLTISSIFLSKKTKP